MITTSLKYLNDFLESKREIYEPLISANKGEKSILMLAYYRNNLTHVFINEAEIACALLGFTLDHSSKGVAVDALWKRT